MAGVTVRPRVNGLTKPLPYYYSQPQCGETLNRLNRKSATAAASIWDHCWPAAMGC